MMVSIDAKRAFDKIHDRNNVKLGTEGSYRNIIKFIYEKPKPNFIFSGERLKAFKIRNKIISTRLVPEVLLRGLRW